MKMETKNLAYNKNNQKTTKKKQKKEFRNISGKALSRVVNANFLVANKSILEIQHNIPRYYTNSLTN